MTLIQDDWPEKPRGVMIRTTYVGTCQLVLSEADWKALRDFAIADATLEQEQEDA